MIERIIDCADLYLLQDGLKKLRSDPQNLCLVDPVKNCLSFYIDCIKLNIFIPFFQKKVHHGDFYLLVFQPCS